MPADQIIKLVQHHLTPQTKILGIGTMMMAHNPAMIPIEKKFELVLRHFRRQRPDLKIIAGGSGAMRWARLTLRTAIAL